jgi:hypothetical protein
MATVRSTTTETSEQATTEPTTTSRLGSAAIRVSATAATVAGATSDAASHLPELADRSRIAFADANRRIQAGSDEALSLGIAASFGLAVGLLIGGASRIIVAIALIPVAMMGMGLLDRATHARLTARGAR